MRVCPTTGKLRLARATPYFNTIAKGGGGKNLCFGIKQTGILRRSAPQNDELSE
jgi:hypothetical protein